jgi:hypothetical protein
MNGDDVTLQELIVRALTGRDETARRSLDDAAAIDQDLQRFCAELDEVVVMLTGCREWRAAKPTPELTAQIRAAVVSKLPAAPPHFRTVLLEADLGRRRAARRLTIALVVAAAVVAGVLYLFQRSRGESERWKLSGKLVLDAPLKGEPLKGFEFVRETNWQSAAEGLRSNGAEDSGAVCLKEGYDAGRALALNVEVRMPALDEQSGVTIFLADAPGAGRPAFDSASRPQHALALEITADSLVLTGPGHAFLQSRSSSGAGGAFLRVRIEHLGAYARVLVNEQPFFDGVLPRRLQGPLCPGVRVSGPRKNEVIFNALRLER